MQTLNASLLPWLIAEFGIDFASIDNTEVATEMIAHIVMKHQLGGYTKSTFPAIIDGRAMQQTAFTKFVLRQLGNSIHFMYWSWIHALMLFGFLSGKTTNVHRNDLRNSLKKLLCTPREVGDRKELVAAIDLGVSKMSDVILSRTRLGFLEKLCGERGIISEAVIFQNKDDKETKKTSIVGEGASDEERAMYWILGKSLSHSLAATLPSLTMVMVQRILASCPRKWTLPP